MIQNTHRTLFSENVVQQTYRGRQLLHYNEAHRETMCMLLFLLAWRSRDLTCNFKSVTLASGATQRTFLLLLSDVRCHGN